MGREVGRTGKAFIFRAGLRRKGLGMEGATRERRTSRRTFSILPTLVLMVGMLAMLPNTALAGGSETIVLITTPPRFLPATNDCPEGVALGNVSSPDGQALGTLRSCAQSFTPIPKGSDSHVIDAIITFVIPTGQVLSTVKLTEVGTWDGSHQNLTYAVSIKGTVTGGTGHFADRTGTVSGDGELTIHADGSITGSDTFVLTLK